MENIGKSAVDEEKGYSRGVPIRVSPDISEEIDLRAAVSTLWANKTRIAIIVLFFTLSAAAISFVIPEVYRAEVILVSADNDQTAGGLASQFGGAAALFGVDIGARGGEKIRTALATLRSRDYIGRFIDNNEVLVPLFAGRWNKKTSTGVIDSRLYNELEDAWLSVDGQPTRPEAIREFLKILEISGPELETGLVTVAINFHNPVLAAEWANALVFEINREIKERDVEEAENAITYLRTQLESTQLVEMQRVFYDLIESQTRVSMLADVRDEYVFRVIDPAVVPDVKSTPQRALITIFGMLLGLIFSISYAFIRKRF